MGILAPCVIVSLLALLNVGSAYLYSSTGNLGGMSNTCLDDLNNIFNDRYLLTSTSESQDTRETPFFVNAQRRLGCRLTLLEALESSTTDNCPPQDQLVDCFWISHDDWLAFDKKCPLFKSQVPLPACSDAAGEAAEGVPSCDTVNAATTGRRLLQGPANNQGIATWQYSYGEAAGLQYDDYAPAGSVTAQPPIAQGVTGADAVALRLAAEGNEGAAITAGGQPAANAGGCFPGMWTEKDFAAYLNGTLIETRRPKDIGGVNAVGVVSVLIYTLLLSSLAFV